MSELREPGGVVVLFALEREAAPFRRETHGVPGVRVVVTGVGAKAARRVARAVLTGPRPELVVVAGFCGALRPGLAVGDVVAPAEVVGALGGRWPCARGGAARLLSAAGLVATPADKLRLGERYSADVVDTESAAVAAVCHDRGVPFVAVRVVSDTVDTALSPGLVALLSGGRVSPLKAAAALVRQPSLLGEFRRLAKDTRLAARNLATAIVQVIATPLAA